MAQLVKKRAQNPVIEVGNAFPATKAVDGALHYALEISEPWQPGGKYARYGVVLSKSEAMFVMAEWLKTMAQQEVAERKRLERSA